MLFYMSFIKSQSKTKKVIVNASNRKTHLKTNSSYRAVLDYDVDRTGVEAW